MWVLLWLALMPNQNMEYFHVNSFANQKDCVEAMSKATVLVTDKNQTVECIWVKMPEKLIKN